MNGKYPSLMAMAALASCASAATPSNPLTGRWHLVSWVANTNPNWVGPQCTVTDIAFTPTTAVSYDPQAEPALTVRYNIQPTRVVVTSDNDVIYDLLGAGRIQREDPAKCTYQRVS